MSKERAPKKAKPNPTLALLRETINNINEIKVHANESVKSMHKHKQRIFLFYFLTISWFDFLISKEILSTTKTNEESIDLDNEEELARWVHHEIQDIKDIIIAGNRAEANSNMHQQVCSQINAK